MYWRRGFTLIEILVVLIVLGILAVIAYPSFRSTQDRIAVGVAKEAVTAVVAAQESVASSRGRFVTALTDLKLLEPEYTYQAGGVASTGPAIISVGVSPATAGTPSEVLAVTALAVDGTCVAITRPRLGAGAGAKVLWKPADPGSTCTADTALAGVTGAVAW